MNIWKNTTCLIVAFLMVGAGSIAHGEAIDNGSVGYVPGSGTDATTTYVGKTVSSNTLYVYNGYQWTSAAGAYVGYANTSSDNTVIISNSSLWEVIGALTVGATNNNNNVVEVGSTLTGDASVLTVDSLVINQNTNGAINSVTVFDNATLHVTGDFNAGMVGFSMESGSALKVEQTLSGLYELDDRLHLTLAGPGAGLATTTNDFYIGETTSGNRFDLESGASVTVANAYIGGSNSFDNVLSVDSSTFVATSNLFMGGSIDSGLTNVLQISGGSTVSVGGMLSNRTESAIRLTAVDNLTAMDYFQSSNSVLQITHQSGDPTTGFFVVTSNAVLEAGAEIKVTSWEQVAYGETNQMMVIEANGLTGSNLVLTADGLVRSAGLSVSNNNLIANLERQYMADAAGFATNSSMGRLLDEFEDMARLENNLIAQGMSSNLFMYSPDEQQRIVNELYAGGIATYQHGNAIYDGVGQVMGRSSSFHMMRSERTRRTAAPRGAQGPHFADQGLQGWAMGYGSIGNGSAESGVGLQGSDQQMFGTVLGLDYSVGKWLFGLAGGYAGSTIETDSGDQSDATTSYGVFYASYGVEEWFGDLNISYGQMSIENTTRAPFTMVGETDATQYSVYAGFGKEWRLQDENAYRMGWRFRPEAGLRIGSYDQDAYTETSVGAIGKDVDAYDRMSIRSRLGTALAMPKAYRKFGLETELRAYWLHEFDADNQEVGYTLADGTGQYQFIMQGPDADVVEVGASLKAIWANDFQLRASVDGQFGSNYQSTLFSASVLYGF